MSDIVAIAQAIVYGAGAAAVSAAVGYAKSHFGKKAEPIDWEKAGATVALGAVLGGIAGGAGITVIDAGNILVSLGLFSAVVYFTEAGAKAIYRFLKSKLQA